jgi:MHS family proline/betaine transporter-like MFS transporter
LTKAHCLPFGFSAVLLAQTGEYVLKPDTSNLLKAVLACMAGNWFELFDFTVYGYFAVQIGRAYFPTHDPIASVLATFATYGVGFLMRPIGGMILGSYGDRRGRKKALALTMFIMAVGTGLTGLIPSYTQWGLAAPMLLVACRMLQGFSTGVNGVARLPSW